MDPVPTGDEARAFFGLTSGSCTRYRFRENMFDLFGEGEVTGPNDRSIASRTVYEWTFRRNVGSGGLADGWFIEAQDGASLRLLRLDTTAEPSGNRQTKIYPEGQEPLLLEVEFDESGMVRATPSQRIEVSTMPTVTVGVPQAERHILTVQPTMEPISVPYETDPVDSVGLEYRVMVGSEAAQTTVFRLVPGRGIARIIEPTRTYVACDWRTCDVDGACTGANSCQTLSCN